jgi:hypothetical protein
MLTPEQIALAGQIRPPIEHAAYEYNGKFYSAAGLLCDNNGKIIEKKEEDPTQSETQTEGGQKLNLGEEIDLLAWAKNEKQYLFADVKAVLQQQYNENFASAKAAKDFVLARLAPSA